MSRLRTSLLALAISLSAVVSICATGDVAVAEGSFKLATFNAGLVRGGVALVDERLPHIAPALQAADADVLCLQEVWGDDDYEELRAALAKTHPHAFRQRTEKGSGLWFSCNPFKLLSLDRCVDSQCTPNGVSAEECVQKACKEPYDALSDGCIICLAANTESPTRCIFRANEYVQGGRNGLALFSKHPITDARFQVFNSALVNRGLIRATVAGRAIACTHLSSDLTTVPYPPGHPWSSWREEQTAQIETVINTLPTTGCRIVLGDLNASQDAGRIRPELDGTLAAFSERGFREPWPSPECTWCPPPANPLASGREEKQYDHILANGCGTPQYRRILDQPLEVTYGGRAQTTRLSDHFGLMAEMPR